MKHMGLSLACEGSLNPKYTCKVCGENLWTERSPRTGGREWLYTRNGQRHYKKKCNLAQKGGGDE